MAKLFFAALAVSLMVAGTAKAYSVHRLPVAEPYAVLPIDITKPELQLYVGELDGFPEMYEITVAKEMLLELGIRAVDAGMADKRNLSGILIRDKAERGVEEVARLSKEDVAWSKVTDPNSGLEYFDGPLFARVVPPGTYRIEISTPANEGRYMLAVGDPEAGGGYFEKLAGVAALYDFYGHSKLAMIRSPLVHYPLGIILVMIGLFLTWRYQTRKL